MTSGPAEFQGALVRLGSGLKSDVAKLTTALARFDRGEAMRYVTDAYPELATPYIAAAGDLSASWYEAQPARAGAREFFARPAPLPTVEQLAANGRWALTQSDPSKSLQGAGRRAIFNESRDTIAENAEEEGVRWLRHARAGACGFCRMLATRVLTVGHGGAPGLYRSEGSASRSTHRMNAQGHDFCRCVAVPLRGGAEYVVPDYLPQWLDDYERVSRDDDGRLLPAQTIANRMEALGRERGEYQIGKPKPRRRPADPGPDVVDLDAPAGGPARDRVAGVQRLTERNADRAEQAVLPIRDRVAQAAVVTERADEIVTTAAAATARVKQVTDVADRLLGGSVPIVRSVKQLVDAADKGLQTAAGVTGPAAEAIRLADRTLDSAVGIAHGVKQIADEAVGLLDEGVAIAVAARSLVADSANAARSVAAGEGGLSQRVTAAVEDARRIQTEAGVLVDRARGAVDTAAGIVQGVNELPAVMAKPIADLRALAGEVREAAAAVEQAAADGVAIATSARRLMDAIADWRAAQTAQGVADDVPRAPVRVTSERLDDETGDRRALGPGGDRPAIETGPLDVESFDLPERQRAIGRGPLELTAGRTPPELIAGPRPQLALPAAPERLAIEAPKVRAPEPGAIAEWLEAEEAHWAAVQYWRRLDEQRALPAAEAIVDVAPAVDEALEAIVDDTLSAAVAADAATAVRTIGDELRERLARAEAQIGAPDGRKRPTAKQRAQRNDARALELKQAREALAAAVADGTVNDAIVVATKRPKSRPFAEVEAEKRAAADAEIEEAIAAFEEIAVTGDDALIDAAAERMESLERAEAARRVQTDAQLAKIAEKHERQRERREAAKRAEQDEIARVMEELGGAEEFSDALYQQAEAQVVAARTGRSEQSVLEAIRRRDYVARSEFRGKGFEDTLKNEFAHIVEQAYMQAENATNGNMLKRQYENKFDPLDLWRANDATVRKVMSDEMAAWFDQFGRITLPVMRAMVLDGDTNFRRRTEGDEDFLQ